jgi:hypothetical protein
MEGLVNMLSSGVGPGMSSAMQQRLLAQNVAGMGVGQSLFSGGDPWQRSVNLANAVNVLPGGSIYAQNKLSKLDFGTAVSMLNGPGGVPTEWAALGINKDHIRQWVTRNTQSVLARWIDQGGNDRASRLAREVRGKYGGDIGAWGRDQGSNFVEDSRSLGSLLSGMGDEFGSETDAAGYIRLLSGRGGAVPKGARKPGAGKGAASDDMDLITKVWKEAVEASSETFKKAIDDASGKIRSAVDDNRKRRNVTDASHGPPRHEQAGE